MGVIVKSTARALTRHAVGATAVLIVCAMMSSPLGAATWYVNGAVGRDWQSGAAPNLAKRTIQNAIDASANGDTIVIAGGTYFENLRLSKAITLHAYEPQTVKIDGRHAGSCLVIREGAAGCVVDGLVFTHGAPVNSGNKYGGGVNCDVDATIRRGRRR